MVMLALIPAAPLHARMEGKTAATDSASGQSAAPDYELSVERVRGEVYNPWTREMDPVDLRAFRGEGADGYIAQPQGFAKRQQRQRDDLDRSGQKVRL